jgi:hypothetical protein
MSKTAAPSSPLSLLRSSASSGWLRCPPIPTATISPSGQNLADERPTVSATIVATSAHEFSSKKQLARFTSSLDAYARTMSQRSRLPLAANGAQTLLHFTNRYRKFDSQISGVCA